MPDTPTPSPHADAEPSEAPDTPTPTPTPTLEATLADAWHRLQLATAPASGDLPFHYASLATIDPRGGGGWGG